MFHMTCQVTKEQPMPYDSFLLRVWPAQISDDSMSSWRATLIRIRDGATQTFTEPIQLVTFLEGRTAGNWRPTEDLVQPRP
jgi:hypothetical protein